MTLNKLFLLVSILSSTSIFTLAQKEVKKTHSATATVSEISKINSTPAFAELILRRTELESQLESLLIDYTEEFPKVGELRFEIAALQKAAQRIAAVKTAESSKLTLALGKLLVRKAELETDLWSLRKKYGDDQADVKRAKRKVEIYENAVKEILD